jgi:hypothetical protein
MQELQLTPLTGTILALQFAAFGWRVNREIAVGDAGRRTWFPLPDIINILSLMGLVGLCIVLPLSQSHYMPWSRRMLAIAATLIACHPLTMAVHYGLFRKERPLGLDGDFQYASKEEIVTVCLSIALAASAAVVSI